MNDHKQTILDSIRRHSLETVDLPDLNQSWITYPDPRNQFMTTVESVGGRCLLVKDHEDLSRKLKEIPVYRDAKKRVSTIVGTEQGNVDLDSVDDPHQLADVEFAILRGEFGVAENGAVWVTDSDLNHRAVLFVAQHLALVISATEIVDNMHQAYDRIAKSGGSDHQTFSFDRAGFAIFISGPSKTADIEQALVMGAHGPRSLTLFLVESE